MISPVVRHTDIRSGDPGKPACGLHAIEGKERFWERRKILREPPFIECAKQPLMSTIPAKDLVLPKD